MPSTTKRVTFLTPDTFRPLTPPLTPTSPTFHSSTSNKLRKLQATKRSLRYPSHISSSLKVNLDLHPLPLNSFTLLNSPTSPLSLQTVQHERNNGGDEREEEEFDINYPTIDTKINMDCLVVDFDTYDEVLSDYYSFDSNSNSSEEETISPPRTPLKSSLSFRSQRFTQREIRKPSLLGTFPLPPARFITKEQELNLQRVYLAEDQFLQAKRTSWELSELLEETKFAGLLIENQLDEIRFRLREIKRDSDDIIISVGVNKSKGKKVQFVD